MLTAAELCAIWLVGVVTGYLIGYIRGVFHERKRQAKQELHKAALSVVEKHLARARAPDP